MAKENKTLSPEEQRKKAEKRSWIKFLRGQHRTVLTAVAATAALEMGGEKVVGQAADYNRKIDPVTQPAPQPVSDHTPTAEWPGIDPGRSQVDPDSVAGPERKTPASDLQPAGLNIPAPEYPLPQIKIVDKDKWNGDEVKELCDDLQYDLCEDYIAECEENGYGKEKLSYEQKLELAGSAMGVEMGKVLGENMLPALNATAKAVEKLGAFCDRAAGQNLKDPIVQARLERNGKDLAKEIKKDADKTPASYKETAGLARDAAALAKAEQRYGQSGEKTEENLLDHKIAGVYKYSLKYVKEYDQKQAAKNKSVEKSGPATQKHLAEALSRGGYE